MKNQDSFWKKYLSETPGTLDPVSRGMEILFGLIMVLTFTLTINISFEGRQEVGQMLWAALGCNVAWGIIDAIMFLFTEWFNRGRMLNLLHRVRQSRSGEEAAEAMREVLPRLIGERMPVEHMDWMQKDLKQLPPPPRHAPAIAADFKGAAQVFLLVFSSTFPVAIPFIFMKDLAEAKWASNIIALLLLFVVGVIMGKYAGYRPWMVGFVMMTIGILMVWIALLLGG